MLMGAGQWMRPSAQSWLQGCTSKLFTVETPATPHWSKEAVSGDEEEQAMPPMGLEKCSMTGLTCKSLWTDRCYKTSAS